MKRRSGTNDEAMSMNLDARYEVPTYRNDPVNVYNFVRTHREDPAIVVGLPLISKSVVELSNIRLSFQN
jgi:hypothetical protein